MDLHDSERLARVFLSVLSDTAFVFGDPVESAPLPRPDGRAFAAVLSFRGETTGSITIAVPHDLAEVVAANTLGVSPGHPEAVRYSEDAVRELASILAGHLVASLSGSASKVRLAPPKIRVLEDGEWTRLQSDRRTQTFAVNDRPALFQVVLDTGGPAE